MTTDGDAWIGYSAGGARASLRLGGQSARLAILGAGSHRASSLVAFAANEARANPVVLDLGGHVANAMSGHFETYDYRSFLYDACRLAEPRHWHSQLAAGAYAAALDLATEEEAIICAALQQVASQEELANPISIFNMMGQVEGFRGFYVDKLKGRVGSLRLFDSADDQQVEALSRRPAILDFHRAPYPQAAELGAGLILAKLLAMEHSGLASPGLILVTDAHRLFRGSPRPSHGNLLLVHALSSGFGFAFATDQPASLNRTLLRSCAVSLHSSDSWHSRSTRPRVLPGAFAIEDQRTGLTSVFFPRPVLHKTGDYLGGKAAPIQTPEMTRAILETVERFPLSTDESLAHFLAPEFLAADVTAESARLERRSCLVLEPKDAPGGVRVFSYTVTEEGRKLLSELKG